MLRPGCISPNVKHPCPIYLLLVSNIIVLCVCKKYSYHDRMTSSEKSGAKMNQGITVCVEFVVGGS